jgi:hypothetical protein
MRMTSDIVVLPQVLGYNTAGSWHIAGITANSCIGTTNIDMFSHHPVIAWNNTDMPFMAFKTKDINFFLKMISLHSIPTVNIYMNSYIINGKRVNVGNRISADFQVKSTDRYTGEVHMVNPTLELIPHIPYLAKIQDVLGKWESAGRDLGEVPADKSQEFKDIWAMKATEGAKIWRPGLLMEDEKFAPYSMYLTKTLFSFSKHDHVNMYLKDDIPNESLHTFMYMFSVVRRLKGMNVLNQYYMMGLKM